MRGSSPSKRPLFFLIPLSLMTLGTEPDAVGAPAPSISRCITQMQDKNWQQRLGAAEAVGCWGTAGKPAIPLLIAMLNEKDLRLQNQAARTLACIGPAAIPELKSALKDKRLSVRYWAADALRSMGADAKAAAPDLFEAVKDRNVHMRINALKALMAIDRDSKELAAALQHAARKDQHPSLRLLADLWLTQIQSRDDKQAVLNPFNTPVPRLTPAQMALLDQAVMDLITSEARHANPRMIPSMFPQSAHALIYQGGPEIIPALVRGVNQGIALHASCPFGSLVGRLRTLVQECNDPAVLNYVILNLGAGIPATQSSVRQFVEMVLPIKTLCVQRKANLVLLAALAERHMELVTPRLKASDEEIKADLQSSDAGVRYAALCIAAQRSLRCEDAYMALLTDDAPRIVQLARRMLVSLARGTDFGPPVKATPGVARVAQQRWREWWQYQDSNPRAIKPPEESRVSTLVAHTLPQSEADRLGTALVKAAAPRRPALLKKLQMSKGAEFTDALAAAIPHLKDDDHKKARDALADRLTRMTARTLRDKLTDEDAEVRRAAALAVAMKEDHELIPYLIPLLRDEEPAVTRAVRAALRSLTGEKFGPANDATDKEKIEAIKKWRAWWTEHEER